MGVYFLTPFLPARSREAPADMDNFSVARNSIPGRMPEDGLRGLVALDGLEVIPGPVAVHLQQDHKFAVEDGIFRRQVEGDIVPGTDVTGGSGAIFIDVDRTVHPDIAIKQEGLHPFVEVDAGGKGQGPGADGIHAQFGRIEVVAWPVGILANPATPVTAGMISPSGQQVVFAHQGEVADAAVTGGGFAIGAGSIRHLLAQLLMKGAMIYISMSLVGP